MFLWKPAPIRLVVAVLMSLSLWAAPLSAASGAHSGNARGSAMAAVTTDAVAPAIDYERRVQPIFNRRCIACHGCLGSPCNVKLDSFRGVDRGGFAQNPFASSLGFSSRTDMDVARSTAAWRKRGFYPILSRNDGSPAKNLEHSLLFQMIDAGMRHNSPNFSRKALDGLRQKAFTATCPSTPEALETRLAEHPALGMPYGLPSIWTLMPRPRRVSPPRAGPWRRSGTAAALIPMPG